MGRKGVGHMHLVYIARQQKVGVVMGEQGRAGRKKLR